ncbi:MAG: YeeE/YedE family protein [Halobacteriovoraceae bacterium]|nr:YeeE/YedE family protein [Halobacteriovoraceae bacterium]
MFNLSALITGIIFATGLGLSGMLDPRKIQGFLNISGKWDPSLAFVMLGALAINFALYPFITKKQKPICHHNFSIPTNTVVNRGLIIGSAIFGIGWGISGLCPGPALASMSFQNPQVYIYTFSMLFGMFMMEKFRIK